MNIPFAKKQFRLKLLISLIVVIVVAAIHAFRLGSYLNGKWYLVYYSYASDILMPMSMYFLLVLNEFSIPFLKSWQWKSIIILSMLIFSEVMQFFDIYLFGVTFDPLDIVMYFLGVSIAVVLDRMVFKNAFSNWS